MKICWWNIATWLITGLLMFTVGLIVGAFFTIGVVLFLWVWIILAILWLILLIVIRVLYYIFCRCCWE